MCAAVDRTAQVVASERLGAAQAHDLLRPLVSSPPLARVHAQLREHVPTLDDDRPPSRDIAAITKLIASGDLERACAMKVN